MNEKTVEEFEILREVLIRVAVHNSVNESDFFEKWDLENEKHEWTMDYSINWQNDFSECLNRVYDKINILNNIDINTVSSTELSREFFITRQHCMALLSFFDALMNDLDKISSILDGSDE